MSESVSVNASHVVHETISGETILIHLRTGTYYSLDGIGSELWQLLAAGATRDQILASAIRRYEGDPDAIELGLSGLIDELVREDLLTGGIPPGGDGARAPELPEGRVPFAVPVLQAYTDMQEFMLVDPIHEVDEVAGWPHAASTAP
jgi:hypothetical protein